MPDCIFCKIANGEIKSAIVFEDDKIIAFRDLNPQAPVHILIITKQHFDNILSLDSSHTALLGHLCLTAANIARQEEIAEDGFRLVVNCNALGGQSVAHIHFHLLGGRQMHWPPG
ncbi:histidine triad nucleotide-binding protein [Candidatus Poribacteria bacterium]|nr:histidine triad nucleotide-binding protein [Candidatus Poribacteria bacterium]